ncbi:PIN domain-containing protein [Donghicola sp. C2-DW-16]|uniref:PIN domain-containing protein n=1 Tax=Donghicola mangrovi TaxID=2729614 RepID=A0ABX2PCF0_9RHOB|nr:PIN domain-containing protein [Donghicola mangrovi]NVO26855.1 PIN domain-containing protein [Donghicola mangrovi]
MKVLLDACVLYPTVMREVLIGAAKAGLYQPLWSARILEEWRRAAARLGPVEGMQAEGEIVMLRADFPAATVSGFEQIEPRLYLPDSGDVHVLAAAIKGSADTIVTMNAKDFPRHTLAEEGIQRLDPDQFLLSLHDTAPDTVAALVETVRSNAEKMDHVHRDARALLKKARMPRLGKRLG